MYYVSGKSANGDVFIVDTSDGTEDRCTKREVIQFAKQVEILGVSLRNNVLKIEVYNPNRFNNTGGIAGSVVASSEPQSLSTVSSISGDTASASSTVSISTNESVSNAQEDEVQPILKPKTSVLGFMKCEERKRNEEVIRETLKNRDNTQRVDESSVAQELIALGDNALKHILIKNNMLDVSNCDVNIKRHCSSDSLKERVKSTDLLTYSLALGDVCRRKPSEGIHTSTYVTQKFNKNIFSTTVRLHYKIDSVQEFFEDDYSNTKAYEEATKYIPVSLSLVKSKSRFTLQLNVLGDRLIYAKDITDSYMLTNTDKRYIKASYLHASKVVQTLVSQKVSGMRYGEVISSLDTSYYFKIRNKMHDKLWYYDMANLHIEPLEIKVGNVVDLAKRRICVLEDNLKFF